MSFTVPFMTMQVKREEINEIESDYLLPSATVIAER